MIPEEIVPPRACQTIHDLVKPATRHSPRLYLGEAVLRVAFKWNLSPGHVEVLRCHKLASKKGRARNYTLTDRGQAYLNSLFANRSLVSILED